MGNILDGEGITPPDIQELESLCQDNPVDIHMKVETVNNYSVVKTDDENTKYDNEEKGTNLSQNQQVRLFGSLNRHLKAALQKIVGKDDRKSHIIIVVDRSGSMSGNPFNQVKMALEEIISQVIGNDDQKVDVIIYDSKAVTVNYSASTYKEAIKKLNAGGTTSFKAAFDETEAVIRKRSGEQFEETAIIFMTDGRDSVSSQSLVNEYSKKWKRNLQQLCDNIIIHVVGFSRDHDLSFLQRISRSGSKEGLYRYCEPSDGPEALKDKLNELFEYVNWSDGYPIKLDLSLLDKDNKFTLLGGHTGQIDGSIKVSENVDESDFIARADCWIFVKQPDIFPKMAAEIEITLRKNHRDIKLRIPCRFISEERVLIEDECSRALWDLSVLSRDTDILTNQVSKAVTDGNVDGNELKKTLEDTQRLLTQTKVYQPGYDKVTRADIMSYIKEIQTKLDILHGMLAQHLRGETQGISLLARAHDLRYQAKFSKARRQRLMDRRVAQNFNVVKSDAQKADKISVEELSTLSEEALKFYYCILSMTSVKDLLLDSSDLENAIGLGLAVTRPEHVLDNPTSLQIWSISGALVSRSSLMDAFEFKIGVAGPLATHGGFSCNFSNNDDGIVSHATVGASREPINAWLPLFISPTHWTRVKSCLKQSLGSLCTLDPLGYAHNQLDIFYMVLGYMIGQLTEKKVGENQLKLIFAMQRTCKACMEDFHMKEDILQKVNNFLKNPRGRFKNEIPNLFTLIGYLVTLPISDVNKLFEPYMDKTNNTKTKMYNRLWLGIVAELLRRSVSNSGVSSDTKVISILNLLLHGNQDEAEKFPACELNHQFSQYSWQMATNQRESKLEVPEYDPAEGLTVPEVAVKHSRKVDKAMAVLAEYICIESEGKKGSAQLSEAKGIAKKWVDEVKSKAGLPNNVQKEARKDSGLTEAETEGTQAKKNSEKKGNPTASKYYDCSHNMTLSTLNETAKVLAQLSRHCFPRLTSVPGCIGFVEYWLSNCDEFDDIIPSTAWIEGMKKAVQGVYSKINDFKLVCAEKFFQFDDDGTESGDDTDRPDAHHGNQAPKDMSHDEDEYDTTQNRRRSSEESITLPVILSALGLNDNQLQLIRAMLSQAVSYCSNSQAREATESGQFMDLTDEGQDVMYLTCVAADLVERKEAVRNKMAQKAAWNFGNESMLQSESVWAFIGYLLKTHQERGEGFKELIELILNTPNAARKFPFLAEKVLVLLFGRFEGHVVFAKGNVWVPEQKLSARFENVLGEEAWSNIERELLSNVQMHVYRESDIPNRQGHSNSNPYIPDKLRVPMGLPLLKDLPSNPNRRKRK